MESRGAPQCHLSFADLFFYGCAVCPLSGMNPLGGLFGLQSVPEDSKVRLSAQRICCALQDTASPSI